MAGRSSAVSWETRVLTWMGKPRLAAALRMASMVQSKQPSTPRMASWRAADEPSSERPKLSMPWVFEFGEDFEW